MSTVFGFGKISCDSARWCNFIFALPKKKLRAASSRTPSSVLRASSAFLRCAFGLWWLSGSCGFNQKWFLDFVFLWFQKWNFQSAATTCHFDVFTLWAMFLFFVAHLRKDDTHTQTVHWSVNMFCQSTTEFYIRVASSFQVSASKGREGGSTYLVVCFPFWAPPTLHNLWWEHHFFLWTYFFVSHRLRVERHLHIAVFLFFTPESGRREIPII